MLRSAFRRREGDIQASERPGNSDRASVVHRRPGGRGSRSNDTEAAMTPAIGIGFLSLTGILLIAYVLFLVEQHKLQDELARHAREDERGSGANAAD